MSEEEIRILRNHTVGDVFEYEGRRIKVEPIKDKYEPCNGCIFVNGGGNKCISRICCHTDRPDKTEVIFTELPDGSDGSNGLNGPDGSEGHKADDATASPSPTAPEQAQPTNPTNPIPPISVDAILPIPATLYRRLDYLGLLPNPVRTHNVGASDYADHFIQPWAIWLDYPDLTSWDHDIIKRVLRTKSTDPRITDYEKIIHICEERIRQLRFSPEK